MQAVSISVSVIVTLKLLKKISPCGTHGRLLLRAKFFQVQNHVTQKLGNISKIRPMKFRYCSLVKESAVIFQLSRKMAEEIYFENRRVSNFQCHVTFSLYFDLGSGHMAHHRASLIDLYLYTNFHSDRRNFLWTDGRMDGRTDIDKYWGVDLNIVSPDLRLPWCLTMERLY